MFPDFFKSIGRNMLASKNSHPKNTRELKKWTLERLGLEAKNDVDQFWGEAFLKLNLRNKYTKPKFGVHLDHPSKTHYNNLDKAISHDPEQLLKYCKVTLNRTPTLSELRAITYAATSHEAGHHIQNILNTASIFLEKNMDLDFFERGIKLNIFLEDFADFCSGIFVWWCVCKGKLNEHEIETISDFWINAGHDQAESKLLKKHNELQKIEMRGPNGHPFGWKRKENFLLGLNSCKEHGPANAFLNGLEFYLGK